MHALSVAAGSPYRKILHKRAPAVDVASHWAAVYKGYP